MERGDQIRPFKIGSASREHIAPVIRAIVDPASTLHPDGANVYKFVDVAKHEAVDHSKEYVRDGVHTNTLEGFFSVFKRGMVGSYQHCGERHLQRYLAEFDFRANYRVKLGYDDAMRADIAPAGTSAKRLTYRRTNAAKDHSAGDYGLHPRASCQGGMKLRLSAASFGEESLAQAKVREMTLPRANVPL